MYFAFYLYYFGYVMFRAAVFSLPPVTLSHPTSRQVLSPAFLSLLRGQLLFFLGGGRGGGLAAGLCIYMGAGRRDRRSDRGRSAVLGPGVWGAARLWFAVGVWGGAGALGVPGPGPGVRFLVHWLGWGSGLWDGLCSIWIS